MSLFGATRRRLVAIYLVLAILAAGGVYQFYSMPSAIFPSVTFPLVRIIVNVGEEPAAHMMPTVTRPLEEAVLRVPGVRTVRSTTSRGSSELTVLFAWGTDMQAALSRVEGEMQRVRGQLPASATIDVARMNTANYPIEGYALYSKTHTQAELRDLAVYTLTPALIRIPGVAQVQVQGGRRREFEVRLDRQALAGRGLSVADVIDAIKKDNLVQSAGLTERNHELYLTLVSGRVHDLAGLAAIAVTVANGTPATLGELGRVDTADEISWVRTTAGGQEAVLVSILRQPSASTTAIASGIDALFKQHPELIPKDVVWQNWYDQAGVVSRSVSGVIAAIAVGIGLAALVLLVFLRDLLQTIIASLSILVVCVIVVLLLAVVGETINLMTLAGVAAAIGLIADDAIVVIENIHRRRAAGDAEPASEGVREIVSALIGSSLSTIVIFLPFAFLSGIVGAFFKPLALTMALCLITSFFVAWIAVPASAATFHRRPRRWRARLAGWWRRHGGASLGHGWSRIADASGRGWRRLVGFNVRHGWISALVLAGLLGVAWWLYSTIGSDFLPPLDEGAIVLDYFTPPGTSLTDTHRMLDVVDNVVLSIPDVASYSRRTGTQLGFSITEPNRGDYMIKLKPKGQRRPIGEVIDELRRRVDAIEPAVHTDFGQLVEDELGDLTGGTPQPIDVKIFGTDLALLQRTVKRAAAIIAKLPGVEDVFDGITIAGPALDIRIDSQAAARYRLTTADLATAVAPAINGAVVGQLRVGERMYDLRVFALAPRLALDQLDVRTPSGALIPLYNLARVSTGAPEVEIDREQLKSYFGVTARLAGRNLGGAMAELKARLARQLQLPAAMSIEYGGLYRQQQASFRELLYVLFAGVLLVCVVVLIEFADWRAPLVTALVALATLAGVFLALLITGVTLNISSFVGAIMMVGIAGENAIFVIHEGRSQLRADVAVDEAWRRASSLRLRPVAMTVFATGLAMLPLAIGYGQGSQLIQPLAIAVIGGFVLSGPLVLIALPAVYRLLDRHGRLRGRA
ncbi:MAG TPA: efflux RND transporter permease subunit [Casimicrobiaceae bacterium]